MPATPVLWLEVITVNFVWFMANEEDCFCQNICKVNQSKAIKKLQPLPDKTYCVLLLVICASITYILSTIVDSTDDQLTFKKIIQNSFL